MSKFIRVNEIDGVEILVNTESIVSVKRLKSLTRLDISDGYIHVKESLEQIEAQLLRDEFAMSFASGSEPSDYYEFKHLASDAYKFADAMLKERVK